MKMKTQHAKTCGGEEKIVLREKFVAVNSYIKKESYQINNLSVYLKELEKEGQSNLNTNRRRQG